METASDIAKKLFTRTSFSEATKLSDDCPGCRGTSWIFPEPGKATRCDCQKRRIIEEKLRDVLLDWPEYAGARLDRLEPITLMQKEAVKIVRADPTGNFFFSGRFGSGKTFFMIAQYCDQVLSGGRCLLRASRQIMDELRRSEMQNEPGAEPYISPVLIAANQALSFHLFWDDIEKAPARSSFRAETVFDLLDTLKRRQLGITITSNLRLDELSASLGTAAATRIERLCRQVEL
jgi:DNA replication protein DnaC